MTPKVTIITITHNREVLLKQTIDSVISQTYQDFEYLIIDDGSNDNTEQVVKSFNYPKIKYSKRKKSKKMSELRNHSILEARGKYIALLDSDDLWLPDKLRSHIEVMEAKSEVGYSFSNTFLLKNNISIRPDYFIKTKKSHLVRSFFLEVLSFQRPLHPGSNLIIRRKCLEEIGFLDESLKYGIYDFSIRLSQRCIGAFVNEKLVKIRRHNSNLTLGIKKTEHIDEYIYTLNNLFKKRLISPKLYKNKIGLAFFKKADLLKALNDRSNARKFYLKSIKVDPLNINSVKTIGKLIFQTYFI